MTCLPCPKTFLQRVYFGGPSPLVQIHFYELVAAIHVLLLNLEQFQVDFQGWSQRRPRLKPRIHYRRIFVWMDRTPFNLMDFFSVSGNPGAISW